MCGLLKHLLLATRGYGCRVRPRVLSGVSIWSVTRICLQGSMPMRNIRNHKVLQLAYKVLQLVLQLVYKVLQLVHEVLQLVYKVLQLVYKVLQLAYKVLRLVYKVLQLAYKVFNWRTRFCNCCTTTTI
ncbi:hypothetical protein V8C86DRAFT_1545600 [Haematococcus lacustris]